MGENLEDYYNEKFINIETLFSKKDMKILEKLGIVIYNDLYTYHQYELLVQRINLYSKDIGEMTREELRKVQYIRKSGLKKSEYNKLLEKKNNNNIFINNIYTDKDTKILRVLHGLGIRTDSQGGEYLKEAILMAIDNSSILKEMTKKLYPQIAKKYNTTKENVERQIRYAKEFAFEKGNIKYIYELCEEQVDSDSGNLKNREFIALIAKAIKSKSED